MPVETVADDPHRESQARTGMCTKTHAATGDAEERRPRRVDIGWTACCHQEFFLPCRWREFNQTLTRSASKLPWKALSGTNVMWTFGMTWNTNCAKTTRAPKQPLRVESVRGVRFPRSYLDMGQPNRVASRRLLIPPSWVGCSYSVQLKNRWIPPPSTKKNLHTNSPSDYGGAHNAASVRAALWSPGHFKKVSSVRVQTLRNGADVGELLGADQTVAGCPLPSLAAALSPSGSVEIRTGKTKRSLSPSLSVALSRTPLFHFFYDVCLIQFICFENCATSTASVSKLFSTSADKELKSLPPTGPNFWTIL